MTEYLDPSELNAPDDIEITFPITITPADLTPRRRSAPGPAAPRPAVQGAAARTPLAPLPPAGDGGRPT